MDDATQLFKEDFLCPHCGARDYGRFCSDCGRELTIAPDAVREVAARRLVALGYSRIVINPATGDGPSVEEPPDDLNDFAAKHFGDVDATVLTYALPASLTAEVVLFGAASEALAETVRQRIDNLVAHLKDSAETVLKDKKDMTLSIRTVLFAMSETDGNALRPKAAALKGSSVLRRSSRWRKPLGTVRWRTDLIEAAGQAARGGWRASFDILIHECRMAARQTSIPDAKGNRHDRYSIGGFLRAITREVVGFFGVLLAFVQSRFVFADLIVNKGYPTERIVGHYIVGIGVSVVLPYVLTLGRIGPAELLSFGDLPPILDELAELGMDLGLILIQAVVLHGIFWIVGHRGRLPVTCASLLFVNAFFQIIDRPVGYAYQVAWESGHLSDAVRFGGRLESVRWVAYAFCIVPFMSLNYKASTRAVGGVFTAASAILLVGFGGLFVLGMMGGAPDVEPFNAVFREDQAIARRFGDDVLPALQRNDGPLAATHLRPLISALETQQRALAALRRDRASSCETALRDPCEALAIVLERRLAAFKLMEIVASDDSAAAQQAGTQLGDASDRVIQAVKVLDAALATANAAQP
jgi:hypothetical protein